MTALLSAVVPEQHAWDHVLALPASVDVAALARAWFADARWVTEPVDAAAAAAQLKPLNGARFRGIVQEAPAREGEMSLAPGVVLRGPYPLTAAQTQALDLPSRRASAYAVHVTGAPLREAPAHQPDPHDEIARAFPRGKPAGVELLVARWLVAVARHARGAVLVDGGGVPVVPDPQAAVDLSLFSAYALPAEQSLALLRTVLVQTRLAGSTSTLDGPQEYWLRAETPYDGAITVGFHRPESLPLVLSTIPWRESGPFAYRVRWDPGTADEHGLEHPSQLHSIARTRMAPVVRAVTRTLHRAIAGTVVDDGGFMRDTSYLG